MSNQPVQAYHPSTIALNGALAGMKYWQTNATLLAMDGLGLSDERHSCGRDGSGRRKNLPIRIQWLRSTADPRIT
jgi:hypothetical protein